MYSIEQRVFLVLEYHRLERSPTATRRSFQKRFNVPKGADATTIRKLFAKFELTGSVDDNRVGNVGPRQTVATPENVAQVSGIVLQNPRNTVRRLASETGLKRSTVGQRFDFANKILRTIDNEGSDVGYIWFTDEAHFHLNGFVNKQNWRFWGSENPHLCEEKSLHSPKVTAWVAHTASVGGSTKNRVVYIRWARPHRTEKVFRFLDEYFGNRVIALDYPKFTGTVMDWPPYSPLRLVSVESIERHCPREPSLYIGLA
ncbi:hypothetical protein AVEN_265257-1 [Araneus ventricosus]|uniref:DUF4817 domain-containing protein n=1 Tax=Araneus ventricosus TaxID=182803 RepID=A0A4Y2SXW2_ARAVE|nr:hypothetical protein AVEN_265257-1 [Araneus ventricosus]